MRCRIAMQGIGRHLRREETFERRPKRLGPAAEPPNPETLEIRKMPFFKNLLMPLFLMGCFPVDFQDVKRPLRTKSVKRPIKVGKRPINKGKRPIKAKVLVGVSVGSLMGCFRAPPTWRKTAPLKRPIKRSMNFGPPGKMAPNVTLRAQRLKKINLD